MDGDAGPYMPVDLEVLPRVLKVLHRQNIKRKNRFSKRYEPLWQTSKGVRIIKSIVLYSLQ